MSVRLVAACAAAIALAACASAGTRPEATADESGAPPRAVRPNVNLSGYSPAFKEGYVDGCDSARGSQRRNAQRYAADTNYMMGWNDGHSACGARR
jgi:hypothetical protein